MANTTAANPYFDTSPEPIACVSNTHTNCVLNLSVEWTNVFKRDYKRAMKRKLDKKSFVIAKI